MLRKREHPFRRPVKRNKIRKWFLRNQWLIIGVSFLIVFILGFIGYKNYYAGPQNNFSLTSLMYFSLQLFVLESSPAPVTGTICWQLELARWLAPLVAAYTALRALSILFNEHYQSFRLKYMRNHVVVCGLGEKGHLISERFNEAGFTVVGIEKDEGNDKSEICRAQGIIVLDGDATDLELLRKSNLARAKYLISVCGDDGINAEIAALSRSLLPEQRKDPLTCFAHIIESQLCSLLKERELSAGKPDSYRLEFFNIFATGAGEWLMQHPLIQSAEAITNDPVHPLIVGFGNVGQNLLLKMAKQWYSLSPKQSKLPVTLIDWKVSRKVETIIIQHPQLKKTVQFSTVPIDVESPDFQRAEFLFNMDGSCRFTSVYICFDNDALGLYAALILVQKLKAFRIPIYVRMRHESGLATLLNWNAGQFENLKAFGLYDQTCRPEAILNGTLELLARAIHDRYLDQSKQLTQMDAENPSRVKWEDLPDQLKESNRKQADHISLQLRRVQCEIVPQTDWDSKPFEFSSAEIEKLAIHEHIRWLDERTRQGWKYTKDLKDIRKKKTPNLVVWEDLPDEMKELNRAAVREIPALLAQVGFDIQRKTG
jgi:hypothetical protein